MSLSLKNLTIGYVGRHHTHVVQRNINADIHSGQLTCLLGANGIGKSTLLRTLAAFQPALEGEVWLNDKRIDQLTPNELSQLISVVLTEKPEGPYPLVAQSPSGKPVLVVTAKFQTRYLGRLDVAFDAEGKAPSSTSMNQRLFWIFRARWR